MKTVSSIRRLAGLRTVACVFIAIGALATAVTAQTGSVRGVVTDSAQGKFVEGAMVTVANQPTFATTDRRGEFLLMDMPAGEHQVQVTFSGMEPHRATVRITPAQTTEITVQLKDDIIRMGQFSVISNRSSDALAITEQRNAPNIKNVVDIASYGRLNNDNPAELLQLLPGVFGSFFAGEVDRVTIRGISSALNTVELDGNALATPALNGVGTDRSSVLSTTNANNIKTAEVIKALTPDRSADAIGGMVNLIQRTGLDYPKSAGRFEYNAGGQYVTTKSGWDTRVTPQAQFTYHDTFGAQRNWGVYATGGMNKETTNWFNSSQTVVRNATFGTIPNIFSYEENDRFRYRKNWAGTFNYRPNTDHEFVLKYKYDEWFEDTETLNSQFASTSPTPEWTRNVRTYNSGTNMVNHAHNPAHVKSHSTSFEGQHRWRGWNATYNIYYSRALTDIAADTNDHWGTAQVNLVTQLRYTYVVDSSRNFLFPTHRITSGNEAAVYNPDNYTLGTYQQINNHSDDQRKGGRFDLKRAFGGAWPFTLKVGVAEKEQSRLRRQRSSTHQFVGEDGVMGVNPATGVHDDRLSRFADADPPLKGPNAAGNHRPFFLNLQRLASSYREQPGLWRDDVYTNLANSFVNNFRAKEESTAAYIMAESDWRKLHLLGGVRWEDTEVQGVGVFRNPVQATATQIPDPVQRAINNVGRTLQRSKSYDNWFPSVHASYPVRPNLLLRASYSTGIGRPGYGAIIPTTTINDTTRVVTTNNTALMPQYADNYDLSCEYFFEPVGIVSVGLFRKDIRNYIVSDIGVVQPGSDFGEQYVGYELRTQKNGGSAKVEGFEFNCVQQLNFIPRRFGLMVLKGNLTVLSAEGDFGGSSQVQSSRVPNFVPRAWNIVGEYTKGRLFVLCRYNHQGPFLVNAGADPSLDNISAEREKIDVNVVYRWRQWCEFFCAVDNVTKRLTGFRLWGQGDRPFAGQLFAPQRRFNFGVKGRF